MKNSNVKYKAQQIIDSYNFLSFEDAKKCALVAANLVREIYYYESNFWDEVKEIIEHGHKEDLIVSDKADVYDES